MNLKVAFLPLHVVVHHEHYVTRIPVEPEVSCRVATGAVDQCIVLGYPMHEFGPSAGLFGDTEVCPAVETRIGEDVQGCLHRSARRKNQQIGRAHV